MPSYKAKAKGSGSAAARRRAAGRLEEEKQQQQQENAEEEVFTAGSHVNEREQHEEDLNGEDRQTDEDSEEDSSEYEVENIIAYRETNRGIGEWRVRWKGFAATDDTWEQRANLEGSPAFWKRMDMLQRKWRAERETIKAAHAPRSNNKSSRSSSSGRSSSSSRSSSSRSSSSRSSSSRSSSSRSSSSNGRSGDSAAAARREEEGRRERGQVEEGASAKGKGEEGRAEKGQGDSRKKGKEREGRRGKGEKEGDSDGSRAVVVDLCRRRETGAKSLTRKRPDKSSSSSSNGANKEKDSKSSSSDLVASSLEGTKGSGSGGKAALAAAAAGEKETAKTRRTTGRRPGADAARGTSAAAAALAPSASQQGEQKKRTRGAAKSRSAAPHEECSSRRNSSSSSSRTSSTRRNSSSGESGSSKGSVGEAAHLLPWQMGATDGFSGSARRRQRGPEPQRKRKKKAAEEERSQQQDVSLSSFLSFGLSSIDKEEDTTEREQEERREREEQQREEEEERRRDEGDDECESETSAGSSTTPEDSIDPFASDSSPTIYHLDTEPPPCHLPDEKLLGSRLSIYRFRMAVLAADAQQRELRGGLEEETETALAAAEEEQGQQRQQQERNGFGRGCGDDEGEVGSSSSSGTDGINTTWHSNSVCGDTAGEDGGDRSTGCLSCAGEGHVGTCMTMSRRRQKEVTVVFVQYMIDAKYVYALPFERMRFYCPQLLLSYLMARMIFNNSRTGKRVRLADTADSLQERDEDELATAAATSCSASLPAGETAAMFLGGEEETFDNNTIAQTDHEEEVETRGLQQQPEARQTAAGESAAAAGGEDSRPTERKAEAAVTEGKNVMRQRGRTFNDDAAPEEEEDHCEIRHTQNVHDIRQLQGLVHFNQQSDAYHALEFLAKSLQTDCRSYAPVAYGSDDTCNRICADTANAALAGIAGLEPAAATETAATGRAGTETATRAAAVGGVLLGARDEFPGEGREQTEGVTDGEAALSADGQCRTTTAFVCTVNEEQDNPRTLRKNMQNYKSDRVKEAAHTYGAGVGAASTRAAAPFSGISAEMPAAEMTNAAAPAAARVVGATHRVAADGLLSELASRRHLAEAGRRPVVGMREFNRETEPASVDSGTGGSSRRANVLVEKEYASGTADNVVARVEDTEKPISRRTYHQEEKTSSYVANYDSHNHGNSTRNDREQGSGAPQQETVHVPGPMIVNSRTRSQQNTRLQTACHAKKK